MVTDAPAAAGLADEVNDIVGVALFTVTVTVGLVAEAKEVVAANVAWTLYTPAGKLFAEVVVTPPESVPATWPLPPCSPPMPLEYENRTVLPSLLTPSYDAGLRVAVIPIESPTV